MMSIEKAKLILDKGLQRCQNYAWKDWPTETVEQMIKEVKEALNEEE